MMMGEGVSAKIDEFGSEFVWCQERGLEVRWSEGISGNGWGKVGRVIWDGSLMG